MKIKEFFKRIGRKIQDFFLDESGGNLIEYALLIGFALFIFFILVAEVTGLLDYTTSQIDKIEETGE